MAHEAKGNVSFPPKPPSEIYKGYGLSPRPILTDTITIHTFRDAFTISTWLLIGASLQCILLIPYLHIRPSHAIIPALSLLAYRLACGILMCIGMLRNPYADGVVPGKRAAVLPPRLYIDGLRNDGDEDGGICVIILFARCHSPLGMFAPQYATLSAQMRRLISSLETSSPRNGFLGGSSFVNTCSRTSNSEVVTLCYFSSHASLQEFAHGTEHRDVWEWWSTLARNGKVQHISIAHEVFKARKGEWEGVYINQAPGFMAATQHLVKDGKDYKWTIPLVEAKGRYKSALRRMEKSDGNENEVYSKDPWVDM